MAAAVRIVADPAQVAALMDAIREGARVAADAAARKVVFDILAEVVRTVPVDTGRLRAGWRLDSVEVVEESETAVQYGAANEVEYAAAIEYGTEDRPPGNHLAVALENAERRVQFDSSSGGVRGLFKAEIRKAVGQ